MRCLGRFSGIRHFKQMDHPATERQSQSSAHSDCPVSSREGSRRHQEEGTGLSLSSEDGQAKGPLRRW